MEKELRLTLSYSTDKDTIEEAFNELEERFASENTIVENEFWDNLELVELKEQLLFLKSKLEKTKMERDEEFEELKKENNKLRQKLALCLTELTPKEQDKVFRLVNEIVNNECEQENLCD